MAVRSAAVGGLAGFVVAAGGVSLLGVGPAERAPEASVAGSYAVLVPPARYQAIVVSPEPGPASSLQFTIRTRDRSGKVSDFPFFVRPGELSTIPFPAGWSPAGESILLAADGVTFAAWGVAAGHGTDGVSTAGPLVRFEPIARDPERDRRDRDRERDFETMLRAAERNR